MSAAPGQTLPCPLCGVGEACRRREHPWLVAELRESFAVLGENQGCAGWCVLVLKEHAEHLDLLALARQAALFEDVSRVARAIRRVFPESGVGSGPPRINYECLGNQVGHVHWHVIPRHAGDPTPKAAVWGWTPEALRGSMSESDRAALRERIRRAIAE